MSQKNKKLKIYCGTEPIDWFSLSQVYSPLIGAEATLLFLNLISQKTIHNQLNSEFYNFEKFLRNINLESQNFNQLFSQLEKVDLVQSFYTTNIEGDIEISLKIKKIKTVAEALLDTRLFSMLKEKINTEKISELKLISEEKEFNYEVTLLPKNYSPKETEILDKKTFCEFYNGLLKIANCEFSMSDEILRIVKETYSDSKKISMKRLQELAFASIIAVDKGKCEISEQHFSFLIDQETKKLNSDFNLEEHKNFWRYLKIVSNNKLLEMYEKLFANHDCQDLYKLLTSKTKVPEALNKWIKDNKSNCSFPLLNGIMSFVMSLLGKIPVNYLIKVTNTLIERERNSEIGLISLVREVIDSDLSNGKNRLNAKLENHRINNLYQNYA